jgi:hypothetical protein
MIANAVDAPVTAQGALQQPQSGNRFISLSLLDHWTG